MIRGIIAPLKSVSSPSSGTKDLGRTGVTVPSDSYSMLQGPVAREAPIPDIWTSVGLLFSLACGMAAQRRPRDPMKYADSLRGKLYFSPAPATVKSFSKLISELSQQQLTILGNSISNDIKELHYRPLPPEPFKILAEITQRLDDSEEKLRHARNLAECAVGKKRSNPGAREALSQLIDYLPVEHLPTIIFDLIKPMQLRDELKLMFPVIKKALPRLTGNALLEVARRYWVTLRSNAEQLREYSWNEYFRAGVEDFRTHVLDAFSISQKLRIITGLIREEIDQGLVPEQSMFWLNQVPTKALADFAKQQEDPKIKSIAAFISAGMPLDVPQIWQRFFASNDPTNFLDDIQERSKPYRYGKEINVDDEEELLLAYVSMDRPSGKQENYGSESWNWGLFAREMKANRGQKLPAPFLTESFSFTVPFQRSIHEKIDKGLLRKTISEMFESVDLEGVRKAILQLIQEPPPSVREALENWVADYRPKKGAYSDADLIRLLTKNRDHILKMIKEIVPILISKGNRADGDVVHYIEIFLLFLAFHSKRHPKARTDLIIARSMIQEKQLPSGDLARVLLAARNILADPLSEISRRYKVQVPARWAKMRQVLDAEAKKIEETSDVMMTAEVLPTKCSTDRFHGHVGEDCTKGEPERIRESNFQIARLIVNNRWEGAIYAEYNYFRSIDALVLTIAIAPRRRLSVNYDQLLLEIEKGFAKLVENSGRFKYLSISADDAEQGNLVDMQAAIGRRRYRKISLAPRAGSFFQASKHYILYKAKIASKKDIPAAQDHSEGPVERDLFDMRLTELELSQATLQQLELMKLVFVKQLGHYTKSELKEKLGNEATLEIDEELKKRGHYLSSLSLEARLETPINYLDLASELPQKLLDVETKAKILVQHTEEKLIKLGYTLRERSVIKRALRQLNLYLGMKV